MVRALGTDLPTSEGEPWSPVEITLSSQAVGRHEHCFTFKVALLDRGSFLRFGLCLLAFRFQSSESSHALLSVVSLLQMITSEDGRNWI